jgi:alpha-glucosidase
MHQFLKEQPQLNAHNPAVQNALLDVAALLAGSRVDGFRLDALNHSMFDPALTDNPPRPRRRPRTRPLRFQAKVNSQNHPDVVALSSASRDLRAWRDLHRGRSRRR